MTSNKAVRLVKALWEESLRRVPYIILVLLTLTYAQGVHNSQVLRTITLDNKTLNEQAVRIAKENAAHIDCVAILYANGVPVRVDDLNKCVNRKLYN